MQIAVKTQNPQLEVLLTHPHHACINTTSRSTQSPNPSHLKLNLPCHGAPGGVVCGRTGGWEGFSGECQERVRVRAPPLGRPGNPARLRL